MDIDKLNYIIMIGEEKSFSKAAKKLFVSQPALSQYICGIENELGIKLFDRRKHPIQITTEGEIFIKKAKEMLHLKHNLIREIQNSNKKLPGTLTIGISPFRSTYLLPIIISELQKKFPGIKFKIFEKHAKELEKLLEKGHLDIAIMSLPFKNKNFSYIEFYTEETFLITPREEKYLTLSEENNMVLSDLKNENFILPYEKIKLREKINSIFYNHNFFPNISFEIESQECILSLISNGLGVGFTSGMSLKYGKWKNKLYHFSLKDENIIRKFAVVYKQEKILNEIENSLVQILIESFE